MKKLLLYTLLLYCTASAAQPDTSYIQKLPNDRVFGVITTLKNFDIAFSTTNSQRVYYQNSNLGIGIRLRYEWFGLSLSVPVIGFDKFKLGDPRSYNLGFSVYPSSFFFQGNLRHFTGFSNINALNENPAMAFREDMKMFYGNLEVMYLLNASRYSLRSAFKMIDRQKQSAGSWLVSTLVNYQKFSTDSLSLPLSEEEVFKLDLYKSFKGGLGGGYAYTYVWKNWSATGLVTSGVEFRRLFYRDADTHKYRNRFVINPRIRLFGSIIHNSPSFFYGLTFRFLPGVDIGDRLNTRVKNWRLRFTVGWRLG